MFRNFLNNEGNYPIRLSYAWIKKIDGLIRVVIPDQNGKGFVVAYFEHRNEYAVIAFDLLSGEILWSKSILNGGYGSPCVTELAVIAPTKFTNVIALDKRCGDIIWTFETKWRIRSSINVRDGFVYFSSGGTIYKLDSEGRLCGQWDFEGAFFYGSIDVFENLVITLGTCSNEEGESVQTIFAFDLTGEVVYNIPISLYPIVSSDTAGIACKGEHGFIGGNNCVICFKIANGEVVWSASVDGFAGRQVCTVDDKKLYYSTQSGIIGSLNIINGSHVWSIATFDKFISSPISKFGSNLLVPADACLNILQSSNGQIIDKIPIGHAPYSMVSLHNGGCFIGAGEPPHNGLLIALKFDPGSNDEKYLCQFKTSNTLKESCFFDLVIEVRNCEEVILTALLEGSIFHLDEAIIGGKSLDSAFTFRVPIPPTICSGEYVILLNLILSSGVTISRPVLINIQNKNQLPTKAYLNFIPEIVQEQPNLSGAAIASTIREIYGDKGVPQVAIREMVDKCRGLARYQSFDTWRVLLRRVFTSGAHHFHELPEFKSNDH